MQSYRQSKTTQQELPHYGVKLKKHYLAKKYPSLSEQEKEVVKALSTNKLEQLTAKHDQENIPPSEKKSEKLPASPSDTFASKHGRLSISTITRTSSAAGSQNLAKQRSSSVVGRH